MMVDIFGTLREKQTVRFVHWLSEQNANQWDLIAKSGITLTVP